jgi:hypothetical protein
MLFLRQKWESGDHVVREIIQMKEDRIIPASNTK